jgi:xanthine dehydrogenase accessory factor
MDILGEISTALESEECVMLATIISTNGSTPASAFSKMLIRDDGKSWSGTVGGGCMEGDVLEAARKLFGKNRAEIMTFHLNEDDMVQGLICGGSLDVLIEPITRDGIPLFKEIKAMRDEGEDGIIATTIDRSGKVVSKLLVRLAGGKDGVMEQWREMLQSSTSPINHPSAGQLDEETRKAHQRNETRRLKWPEGELIFEPFSGQPNLIIFGGGHVSKSISRIASLAGFRMTIVDDRKEYANAERFPEAAQTLAVEFHDAFSHLSVKSSSYIVIVTRGHRSDEDTLERALHTPAKYVGMIGSKRKVLTTYEHLVERGVTVTMLQRVHAPIGLEIGAVTVEEIGVSIVAELVQIRRGGSLPLRHKAEVMRELMEYLRLKQAGRIP